ncbi:hypothetical protein HYE67_003096 [Fusarium culmorum]|uniref:Major facilitator superfamily (MFS) profile domain-containing protein n=1 Tax=Fusarium culmorum TaxID=5516 RepID=A0A7S8HU06_FUSCU|nr:hypothetical protein HYE67_003096 [Fusarium culmorum]
MHSQSADLESSGSAYKATSAYYYVGADIIRTPTRAELERRLGVSLWCPANQPRGMDRGFSGMDCNWAQFTCEFDGTMLDGMQSLPLWQEAFGNPGYLVAAWTTFSTFKMNSCWSWRLLSLLQGVPAILQLVLSIRVPESPRWLVYKDQRDEAMNVLSKHSCGDV